jgi:hypothetical protein
MSADSHNATPSASLTWRYPRLLTYRLTSMQASDPTTSVVSAGRKPRDNQDHFLISSLVGRTLWKDAS